MYHINNKNSVWQLYTDFIPVTNDIGKLMGFKRYKKHRFDESKTKIVYYDENKKFFMERRGSLDTHDIKAKYVSFVM